MNDIPPTIRDDLDDDQFDEILTAMLAGTDPDAGARLDPTMRATIDQLLSWADRSGYATEPVSPAHVHWKEQTPMPPLALSSQALPMPARSSSSPTATSARTARRTWSWLYAGIAAVLLLGIVALAIRPFLTPSPNDEEPTISAIEASALASGDDTTDVPEPTVAIGEPGVNAAGVDPLTSDECTVAPVSRQHVLTVLSTPPGNYGDLFNAKSMYIHESFDDIPLDTFSQIFREWQACVKYGSTWQYMALQTDYMTRLDIYGEQVFDRGPILEAYSQDTLNELLDGRVLIDNDRRQRWADYVATSPAGLPEVVLVIDTTQPASFSLSEDGTYVATLPVAKLSLVSGEQRERVGSIDFLLVNGDWKIYVSPNVEF